VDEDDFWARLAFRIGAELRSSAEPRLRYHWCDGLVAEEYDLAGPQPCIRGRAWCGPSGQERWRFVLVVGAAGCDWPALLPGAGATGWLTADPGRKLLTIDQFRGRRDQAVRR
jgi:hypothetical protein